MGKREAEAYPLRPCIFIIPADERMNSPEASQEVSLRPTSANVAPDGQSEEYQAACT